MKFLADHKEPRQPRMKIYIVLALELSGEASHVDSVWLDPDDAVKRAEKIPGTDYPKDFGPEIIWRYLDSRTVRYIVDG